MAAAPDIYPMGANVVIKPVMIPETKGGIVIPDTYQVKNEGVVVAVGPGTWRGEKLVPVQCKVGDYVVFIVQVAIPLYVDAERFVVLREDQLLVVLGGK